MLVMLLKFLDWKRQHWLPSDEVYSPMFLLVQKWTNQKKFADEKETSNETSPKATIQLIFKSQSILSRSTFKWYLKQHRKKNNSTPFLMTKSKKKDDIILSSSTSAACSTGACSGTIIMYVCQFDFVVGLTFHSNFSIFYFCYKIDFNDFSTTLFYIRHTIPLVVPLFTIGCRRRMVGIRWMYRYMSTCLSFRTRQCQCRTGFYPSPTQTISGSRWRSLPAFSFN